MNREYKIKKSLKKVGREILLADGEWTSAPFWAVLRHGYKKDRTNFEAELTEIGFVSKDYFMYIGPFDHDITALSDNAIVLCDGVRYVFRKKERVVFGGKTIFYFAILKKVQEAEND